jgi:predicted MPP superfamily phosphohydrolase
MKRVAPDLFLCGHTHGGQVCLPGGRALLTHDKLPKHICKGIFRAGNTWMAISRGFGFAGMPARVFCPSEVIEITTVRE